jgi:hypothetical protein
MHLLSADAILGLHSREQQDEHWGLILCQPLEEEAQTTHFLELAFVALPRSEEQNIQHMNVTATHECYCQYMNVITL